MTKKKQETSEVLDIKKTIEKQFGPNTIFSLDYQTSASYVTDFISTGSDILDLAISNRKRGGLPVGRLIQISSLQAGGKSLICAHLIAQTQKRGGIGVYIDTQSAASPEFLRAIGVNTEEMIYIQNQVIEQIYQIIIKIIQSVRGKTQQENKPITIVVDSLTAASSQVQLQENDIKLTGFNTPKSRLNSKYLGRITNLIARQKILLVMTSQLRMNLKAMPFSDPYVTSSGGTALQYYASTRIRLKLKGKIKGKIGGIEGIVGIKTQAEVKKNRIGPPFRSVVFDLYFDSGIDNYGSWLQQGKKYGVIKQSGAWSNYTAKDGEQYKFQAKNFIQMLQNDQKFKNSLYDDIAQAMIMKYRNSINSVTQVNYDSGEDE